MTDYICRNCGTTQTEDNVNDTCYRVTTIAEMPHEWEVRKEDSNGPVC